MSKKQWAFDVGLYEIPDIQLVQKYRTFIDRVMDGVILCYRPYYSDKLKRIESRIKRLTTRIHSLNDYLSENTVWDRELLYQKDAILAELKMLYADKDRTLKMSDNVKRSDVDRNLRQLHKAAQYLYRWGILENYIIKDGMISGTYFDKYTQPDRKTFDTIKWDLAPNDNPVSLLPEHITNNLAQYERRKMDEYKPVAERKIFNGDIQWDKNAYRCKGVAHQSSVRTLLRQIRRKRKMPLFHETFKLWRI